jgi:hypothetical protein
MQQIVYGRKKKGEEVIICKAYLGKVAADTTFRKWSASEKLYNFSRTQQIQEISGLSFLWFISFAQIPWHKFQ